MWRRLRWVLLALVLVVAGLLVAAVLTQKPTLDDDEQAVDTAWTPLRDALAPRYAALDTATAELTAAGEGERSITQDLAADLTAWKAALDGGSASEQAAAANRLEGQGARLRRNVLDSARLSQTQPLVAALGTYDGTVPSADLVRAYNRAAQTYEDARTDTLRAPVASVFGFDARPRFDLRT